MSNQQIETHSDIVQGRLDRRAEQQVSEWLPTKVIGRRRVRSPEESLRRASELKEFAERFARHPRPRGYALKFRTHEEYHRWRRHQPNPRLW
jgi:hypothetical protein